MAIKNKDIHKIIEKLQKSSNASKMGMIATHLGIVREKSRDGRKVYGIQVTYDHESLDEIIHDIKRLPGIFEVMVETNEGRLMVGDIIMFVAVGGDIRENVFPALVETVDRIKKESSRKKEFFI